MATRYLKSRRSARAEPAQSAEFFSQLAETMPQMLWSARPDGSIDYFNSRVYAYTGRTQRQLVDWGWRAMVHPDDWERCLEHWTRAFKKGQPYEVEYRLRRRDGRYFWHLGAAMPLREGGRIVRWIGSCTDIDKQKRAERLIEKARGALELFAGSRARDLDAVDSRFRGLVRSAPVMVWESGPDKLCTFVNQQWQDFTGRTAEQSMGEGWTKSLHPEDQLRCMDIYHRAFDARAPFEMEFRLRRHDGEYRWIIDHGVPVVDSEHKFHGYIGSCVDDTERRIVGRQQQEQQARFRSFLNNMPAIAWIKDSKFRYLWLSASHSRLFGKTIEQVEGHDDFAIWSEALARLHRHGDEQTLRVNGPVQFVQRGPIVDGRTTRWRVVKFPLPDDRGAAGVAGIGFDITHDHVVSDTDVDSAAQNPAERLSGRERQVLQLVVDGFTSAEVGARLGVSSKSIDTYRSRLMAKLGIEDLPTLVKFALRHGLTT